ncbi:hypothetical protein FNV43_RR01998 [Rhamnella rubrinervis]|uniref:Receptor-like serine/threonine-protein kinase n=1 Tax=Rhamnella rubrinervis TaxID=2594499 RepID=A0A8K0MSJ9_9ROSA|nr:hypothetical protein FNV43_RR01998 [Rhamnella rubrinervis]
MNFTPGIPYILLQFLFLGFCSCLDTISITQSIRDGDVLISNGDTFALGFFSPGKSSYRYAGIWYHKIPEKTVVWVANRDNPINGTSGFLSIDTQGNLVLFGNSDQTVPVWSTNSSSLPTNEYSVAQLLDSGDLVLFQNESKKILWQSFDHPTNTMLSNMKLGFDRRNGLNWSLTSCKSEDDPGIGNYTFRIDSAGFPQLILYNGRAPWWRAGHWNGVGLNGVPVSPMDPLFYYSFVNNDNEITRAWMEKFTLSSTEPCDQYGYCGAFGLCDLNNATQFECTCLPGFEPKSSSEWNFRNAKNGCARKPGSLICRKGEGFVKLENVKVPDTSKVVVNSGLSLEECEEECLRSCNCTAYASENISEGGSGCMTWHDSLMDTRIFAAGGQDFYLRVDERELAQYAKKSKGFVATKRFRAIMVVLGVLILFSIGFFAYWFAKRRRKGQRELFLDANITSEESPEEEKLEESRPHPDLTFFDIRTLVTATDNFSATNMLGQGGFGSVYKGQLVNEQEVAVKRLSKHSTQGMQEFKNEVTVIAKLQHRNLVKLLGCCVHKEERMLIYEYLPNKSLDHFIFDATRRAHLDWNKRFEIVCGIARGILYLHQDSRLKIIHRDLKASNVLLDASMNPKISDFGMAKMFGEDQIQANTKRVVGTYGYMSPEYAMQGLYSTKSDIFSFGVLVLEIISGRKNTEFINGSHFPILIGHVWELWNEGGVLGIVDPALCQPFSTDEISRCIHIGLLCVQEAAVERPTVSDVIFMLANETTLPPPNTHAFAFHYTDSSISMSGGAVSLNRVSITTLEAR